MSAKTFTEAEWLAFCRQQWPDRTWRPFAPVETKAPPPVAGTRQVPLQYSKPVRIRRPR